jgi:phage gp29-like protein
MFVKIVSLMFIFFINYHVVDIIEFLNLFYMPIQNTDEVL